MHYTLQPMFEPGREHWIFYSFLFDPVPDFTDDQDTSEKLAAVRRRVPSADRSISFEPRTANALPLVDGHEFSTDSLAHVLAQRPV
jgi:hypothetical protein